ncbi:MAG: PDZ domain-containing protein [Cyanobacteria bacterium REEB67]|nr:PDZ domain-containing protein [Cyanobacteria bacterium REEB67]
MKYAPDLPPSTKRPLFVALIKLVQTVFLSVAAAALLLVALALYVVPGFKHVSPVELYHYTWAEARADAYDQGNYKDWDKWEHKFDSQIKTDDDAIKYANEMLKSTGDHYARLLSAEDTKASSDDMNEHFVGIGIKLKPRIDANGEPIMGPTKDDGPLMAVDKQGNPLIEDIIPGGPAEKAGIKAGDAFKSVNGKSMQNATMEGLHTAIAGKEGEAITVVIVRQGHELAPISIVRGQVKQEKLTSKMLTAPNGQKVGYIRLDDFMDVNAPDEMANALKSLPTDRIIIDLRHNPGGLMPICLQLASEFVEKGTLVSTRERQHDGGYQTTRFVLDGDVLSSVSTDEATGKSSIRNSARQEAIAVNKQVIILVDGRSASAAEMFTAALQQNGRATVLGEQTFGKGIGQAVMRFPNGTEFHVTTFRYFTPNGTWLGNGGNGSSKSEQFGITPDVKVPFTKAPGIAYGSPRDNQLNDAIDILSRK